METIRILDDTNDYRVDTNATGITHIQNYTTQEVVYVSDNIHKLKAMGYMCDPQTLQVGHTYILTRKNCKLHRVCPLEKLEDIAAHYSVTMQQIMQDNNLSTSKLYIGQVLVIY